MIIRKCIPVLIFSCTLLGCQKEELSEPIVTNNTVNGWIYNQLSNNYLWLDEIKGYEEYDMNSNAENFFNSLISENEKKEKGGMQYCYSYMEKKQDITRAAHYPESTYGMEYIFYRLSSSSSYYARILYVVPNTPAAKAGLKRGMWVKKINGKDIVATNRNQLQRGNGVTLTVFEGNINTQEGNVNDITLEPNVTIYDNPIFLSSIIEGTKPDRKVGYLVYNHFTTGPTGYDDNEYNDRLNEEFHAFKAAGVTDFILDLRYNPGGYLDCAVNLSSFLVKEQALTQVFCHVEYHSKSPLKSKAYLFNNKLKNNNLNLSRVYILTGEWTASASEAVINGLKPMMEVVQIGAVTEGKNLGSITFQDKRYEWILHPIVARISNAEGKGDYWEGITPDIYCNELEIKNVPFLGELGTLKDVLIYKAVENMGALDETMRKTETKISTRSSVINLLPDYSSISRKAEPAVRIN